jgi:hypothetical protein
VLEGRGRLLLLPPGPVLKVLVLLRLDMCMSLLLGRMLLLLLPAPAAAPFTRGFHARALSSSSL